MQGIFVILINVSVDSTLWPALIKFYMQFDPERSPFQFVTPAAFQFLELFFF